MMTTINQKQKQKQIEALFKARTDAQERFRDLSAGKTILNLLCNSGSNSKDSKALYYKGFEEGINFALYLLDLSRR